MRSVVAFVTLLMSVAAFAQELACPAMQAAAFDNIVEHCAEQEAGTLCLGGETVTPVWRGTPPTVGRLDEAGDSTAITDIDWLSVSSEDETWGVARALFPAYAGDDLAARDAALLAFGNVALFPLAQDEPPPTLADVKVTATQGANLRAEPSTAAPIIARLAFSSDLKAIGRFRGGGWLLIYATPDLRGWISQAVVSAPTERLPTLDAESDTAPLWLPWNRFDFRSGIDDAPCPGAPESGILLQTSKSEAPRRFVINGARLSLGGTVWLQAQISSGMLIQLLDGRARLSTNEGGIALGGGEYTHVTLENADDGTVGAGAFTAPAPYDYQALSGLPVQALPYETRVSLDRYMVVRPAPAGDGNPLEALESDATCKFAAVLAGANMRSRPDPEAPVIAVMAFRESAEPIARGIGVDGRPWWKLADRIWVRVDATVSGGNCNDLALLRAVSP